MTDSLPHLLVVDDDSRIRELLKRYLSENGFFVSTAKDAAQAAAFLDYALYDLLIIDVMMPGENGLQLTERLRHHSTVPILMLTAMAESDQRIAGLESGADDYLTKPFEPRELLLRIRRILQRTQPAIPVTKMVALGNLQFDPVKGSLSGSDGDIPLTSMQAKLLSILLDHKGKIMPRELLAEQCGGINERSIDVQIIRLRSKIEADPKKPQLLKTVRGEGYVLYV